MQFDLTDGEKRLANSVRKKKRPIASCCQCQVPACLIWRKRIRLTIQLACQVPFHSVLVWFGLVSSGLLDDVLSFLLTGELSRDCYIEICGETISYVVGTPRRTVNKSIS